MEEVIDFTGIDSDFTGVDLSKVKTDKPHREGDIPHIDELIEMIKTTAVPGLVSHHSGLKKYMPEFKDNLDKARRSYGGFDVEDDGNPLINHKKNVNALLATITKMEKTVGREKFKVPLFWSVITLAICVLTMGAVMLAMPAYVAAGFVCLFAGIIGLVITALTMPSGKKSDWDGGFFDSAREIATKAFKSTLDVGQDNSSSNPLDFDFN